MSWNYRVIDFGTHKALHEVYYDENGKPNGYTKEPADFYCDFDEPVASIINALNLATEGAAKPTLKLSDFKNAQQDAK